MIKIMDESMPFADGTQDVTFYADTKAECTDEAISALKPLDNISMGSKIYTKDLNIAIFDSSKNRTWKK